MKFSELGLAEPFLRATEALDYTSTTPIQAEAIPVVLAGRDLIGCAQTGTGKTAAFALPILNRLFLTQPKPDPKLTEGMSRSARKAAIKKARTVRTLVLAPTRELAVQIGESLKRYGKFTSLRHAIVYGGVSQFHQVKALRTGVDTIVATPGRLIDLMEQGHIDLSKIDILVLDEADQMLDMGFLPALKRIVEAVPSKRQTLMFSATMPPEIRRLAQHWLTKPASIQVAPAAAPAERIEQSVHFVDKKRKSDLLAQFLKQTAHSRALVFVRTKHGVDKVVKQLRRNGLQAEGIHGNKSQNARMRALDQFKSDRPPVLVATDIAARGLDVHDISHVVNFDLPDTPETYVHRIGRTARAGAEGVAVSFCAADEHNQLRQIERLTRKSITIEPVVEGFEPKEFASSTSGSRSGSYGKRSSGHSSARKPSRRPAKPRAGGSAEERTGSGHGSSTRKASKRPAASAQGGPPHKRRRRKQAAKG